MLKILNWTRRILKLIIGIIPALVISFCGFLLTDLKNDREKRELRDVIKYIFSELLK